MVEGTDLRLLKVDDNEATFETGERMLGEGTLVGDERIDEGEDTDELALLCVSFIDVNALTACSSMDWNVFVCALFAILASSISFILDHS